MWCGRQRNSDACQGAPTSAPAACALKLVTSLPPCLSPALAPAAGLLPLPWFPERVSLCLGPFGGMPGPPAAFVSLGCSPLWFVPRCYGDSSFWRWCPGVGSQLWSWNPSQGTFAAEMSRPVLEQRRWVWGLGIESRPPPVAVWLPLRSLVVGDQFSSSPGGSYWWCLHDSVVTLVWSWEEVAQRWSLLLRHLDQKPSLCHFFNPFFSTKGIFNF